MSITDNWSDEKRETVGFVGRTFASDDGRRTLAYLKRTYVEPLSCIDPDTGVLLEPNAVYLNEGRKAAIKFIEDIVRQYDAVMTGHVEGREQAT